MKNKDDGELRQALESIARIAEKASRHGSRGQDGGRNGHENRGWGADDGCSSDRHGLDCGCMVRQLPERLQMKAARTATQINPANAPNVAAMASFGGGGTILTPARISILTAKYWGPQQRNLTVSFMERTPDDLRARIVSHLNAWSRTAGVSFTEIRGIGQVRISLGGGGYWSYLGTDILHIPEDQQTMNLEGFTMDMPEDEFKRVIRHEAGHTLGFPHEHMRKELIARIDRQKAYDYFWRTQGWDRNMVDAQVLTPLDDRTIIGTPPDEDSIMCYQLPGSITRDGKPIRGGIDINETDAAFCARLYPKFAGADTAAMRAPARDDGARLPPAMSSIADWDPAHDVEPDLAALH